jgi:hypothetical protein
MTNWRELLSRAQDQNGDKGELKKIYPPNIDLDREFDCGFGTTNGEPFTAWSDKWVYFPIVYDGAEWVGSAPRNPCEVAMPHQGKG